MKPSMASKEVKNPDLPRGWVFYFVIISITFIFTPLLLHIKTTRVMKRIAVFSLLLSFSLCVLAHSHSPDLRKDQKHYYSIVKDQTVADLKIDKSVAINDHLVIDLVTPPSMYRMYDEYASDIVDEILPVAHAPPEMNRFKFRYSKRN